MEGGDGAGKAGLPRDRKMHAEKDPLIAYFEEPGRERFDRVVRAHYSFVWGIAFRMVRHEEDAADVCQEVFLNLIVRPPPPGRVRSPRGFLAFLVLGRVDSLRRALRRRLRREEESVRRSAREGISVDDWTDLAEALASLPEELRVPVELHEIAGVPCREIGEALGISEQTVTRRVREGRERLRRRLAPIAPTLAVATLKLEGALPLPPADLLRGLYRIGEMGWSLAGEAAAAPTLSTLATGGIIVGAKKIGIGVALAALIVTGFVFVNIPGPWGKPGGGPGLTGARTDGMPPPAAAKGNGATPSKEAKGAGPVVAGAPDDPAVQGPVCLEGKVTDLRGAPVPNATVRALDTRVLDDAVAEAQRRFGQGVEALRFARNIQDEFATATMRVGDTMVLGDASAADSLSGPGVEALRSARGLQDGVARRIASAETDPEGHYVFRGLAPAAYQVLVTHPRYLPAVESWAVVETGRTDRCDVRLAPGTSLKGRAVDEKGTPVPGAIVEARTAESGTLQGWAKISQVSREFREASPLLKPEAVTGGDGSFAIDTLEPVPHDVAARKDGFSQAETHGVVPGKEEIVLVLRSDLFLAGRVLLPDRRPARGAEVAIEAPEVNMGSMQSMVLQDIDVFGERKRRAVAGEDGRFRIAGPVPGMYRLRARAPACAPHAASVEIGKTAVNLGDIILEKGFPISGAVLGPNGNPASGALVKAYKKAPKGSPFDREEPLSEAEADARGSFCLDGLRDGTYEVLASSGKHGEGIQKAVKAGRRDLVIRLGGLAAIKGKTIDAEDGSPVAGVEVQIGREGTRKTTSKEDGSFELTFPKRAGDSGESPAGPEGKTVYLLVRHPDYGTHESYPKLEEELTLKLQRATEVHGTVVAQGSEPVRGARVWWEVPGWPEDSRPSRSTYSAADGTFSLKFWRLTSGPTIDIVAWSPSSGRARITLAWSSVPWPEVQISLRPGRKVEGTVTGPNGAPVEAASIRLTRQAEGRDGLRSSVGANGPPRGRTTVSGRDGSYRIEDLEPSSYRMDVQASGLGRKTIDPVEVGEDTVRLDIALERGGQISGRIVAADGSPFAGAEVVVLPEGEAGERRKNADRRFERHTFKRLFEVAVGLRSASARTGDDGTYRIADLPDEPFLVIAGAPGFFGAMAGPLRPGDEPVPDLVLIAPARIAGRVRATSGDAVRRFSVQPKLLDRSWGDEDVTGLREIDDPDGIFEIEDLDPGKYLVSISANGLSPFESEVRIEPGGEVFVEAVLDEGATVEGKAVSAEDERPLPGVEVYVKAISYYGPKPTNKLVTSDADGIFTLRGLPDGQYVLRSNHPDLIEEDADGLTFVIPSNKLPPLKLLLSGKVKGKIDGLEPLEDMTKGFYTAALFLVREAKADGKSTVKDGVREDGEDKAAGRAYVNAQGGFKLARLRPGTYRVELHKYTQVGTFSIDREDGDMQAHPMEGDPPAERRPLGEVEIRGGETATFQAPAW
jgi:RNA polymerase sigma factor (sigma-70 family)